MLACSGSEAQPTDLLTPQGGQYRNAEESSPTGPTFDSSGKVHTALAIGELAAGEPAYGTATCNAT